MRYIKRFLALAVILYTIVFLAGADEFLSVAIASLPEPLVISTADGETTVGSVQVLNNGSHYTITIKVDEPYEIYSTAVTFRLNSGGITRALSFGRNNEFVTKTKRQHVFVIPESQIKGNDVEIAASAILTDLDGNTYLTPKAFIHASTTTTSISGTTSTTENITTTTGNNATTTTNNQATTTTTVHQGGGGATTTSTSSPAATSTTVAGVIATTTTNIVTSTTSLRVTTTTSPRVAGVTTSTILLGENVTTTITTPGLTTTSIGERIPSLSRERLPYTGMDYNWYLIGVLLIIAGLSVYSIASRSSETAKNDSVL